MGYYELATISALGRLIYRWAGRSVLSRAAKVCLSILLLLPYMDV